MIEMTVPDEEKRKESDQEDNDDDDEDFDSNEKTKPEVHSEDDEQWYDTSPDDIEMRAITYESVGILHKDSSGHSKDQPEYGVLRRQGSLIKDEHFEMIPLKESIK